MEFKKHINGKHRKSLDICLPMFLVDFRIGKVMTLGLVMVRMALGFVY